MEKPQQHILVACYPAQGHINPTLRLSKRLAHEAGVRITLFYFFFFFFFEETAKANLLKENYKQRNSPLTNIKKLG
ncbi:Anthocyanidin 3-O-glucoside 5-O-glucosyltransferase [Dendrobium catenatum]|uniref:Anthocyanidin 3-O-glucoside 5-O-glucosyltransferase n=1 Tax=Dendrobium catenatum TaxID=906689 RepID=A0A2I0W7V6_9ASPA|nr:Anthocyanidin 3-O-glucoside 5-O-glucosyltransferase [Dendrobium catenatum]